MESEVVPQRLFAPVPLRVYRYVYHPPAEAKFESSIPEHTAAAPLRNLTAMLWRSYSRIALLALLGAHALGAFAGASDRMVGRGTTSSTTGGLELTLCSSLRRAQAVVAAALDLGQPDQTAGGVRMELRIKAQLGLSSLEAELRRATAWMDRARRGDRRRGGFPWAGPRAG